MKSCPMQELEAEYKRLTISRSRVERELGRKDVLDAECRSLNKKVGLPADFLQSSQAAGTRLRVMESVLS